MKKFIKEYIPYFIIIIIVVLIRTFLITPARVSGSSMDDTLVNKNIVIVNKIYLKTNKIKRYDIVVVKYDNEYLIKRVIGLPNEQVEYYNNKLYINDVEKTKMKFEKTEDFQYETKKDEYFVMGDNRDISKDSRYFGAVKKENITGMVNFIIFPFNKFGKIK